MANIVPFFHLANFWRAHKIWPCYMRSGRGVGEHNKKSQFLRKFLCNGQYIVEACYLFLCLVLARVTWRTRLLFCLYQWLDERDSLLCEGPRTCVKGMYCFCICILRVHPRVFHKILGLLTIHIKKRANTQKTHTHTHTLYSQLTCICCTKHLKGWCNTFWALRFAVEHKTAEVPFFCKSDVAKFIFVFHIRIKGSCF